MNKREYCMDMITFEEAFRIVTENSFRTGKEVAGLSEAAGRALTVPVRSDMDMPPWNKSAVDGYACRHGDLSRELSVNETIAAGVMPSVEVASGMGGPRSSCWQLTAAQDVGKRRQVQPGFR